jgi:hypothetical protein
VIARHRGLTAGSADSRRDFFGIGSYDDTVEQPELRHALPNADDERKAGEEAEGFAGETRRAQSGWDDGERPHSWRPGPFSIGNALTGAKFTF